VHVGELAEVGDADADLAVEVGLLLGVGGELALHAPHAGEHGVEVLDDILWGGLAVERPRGGLLEQVLDEGGIFFKGEVGGSEVFLEELLGEAEEWLVLWVLVFGLAVRVYNWTVASRGELEGFRDDVGGAARDGNINLREAGDCRGLFLQIRGLPSCCSSTGGADLESRCEVHILLGIGR